ncbi:hypothetical protein FACS1894211_01160 [Clostridia bacterium]|nr:hypothetical protein FACS1894211_01160 [Clostridia bacterium]
MKADFNQFLKILRREQADRPVLFEMLLNDRLWRAACGSKYDVSSPLAAMCSAVRTFWYYGYDCAIVRGSGYWFNAPATEAGKESVSLNASAAITDRQSLAAYPWMDADKCDYSALDAIADDLPDNMKTVVMGPGGVLENVISLAGFDNLCLLLYDDPQLVWDLFEKVGSGLVKYYERSAEHESVGALISNDDWGFNTQTMLSVGDMRKFVFPWHKKIVETIRRKGKPAILHSCGNYSMILNDLFALGYDARHSYEDKIMPVEQAYDQLKGHMAVLGGIDVDFLIRSPESEIVRRCKNILEKTANCGYALGTGNSVPAYMADEKYFALLKCAGKR